MKIHTSQSRRRGLSSTTLIGIGTASLLIIGIAWMSAGNGSPTESVSESDLFLVERGGFDISIPASGDLTSLDVVEIRNDLEGTSTIMELIPEGTTVKEGDLLLKLDDEPLRKLIESESEKVTLSRNQYETQVSNLEITEKRRETNISQAQLRVDVAELSLMAWENGDVVSKRKSLELNLNTAEKDYNRLKDNYEKSIELRAKNFLSQNQLEQDEISMIRAKSTWEQAVLAKDVYENYTFKKEEQLQRSDLEMAKVELTRTIRREDAAVRGATSNVEAYKEGYQNRTDRLARYEDQKESCEVFAPSPGLVVYGSSVEEWRDDKPLRVGTKVSRNELLFILPNQSNMAAELSVNEALSGYVKPGQRVTVVTDAVPDIVLEGEVLTVGVLAEDGGWRDPNRRDYTISVRLDGEEPLNLKPSMRCKGRIYVDRVEDAIFVPVHAVGREGMIPFVWAAVDGGYEQKPVTLGPSSELYVVIEDGIEENQQVLLRDPVAGTIVSRINEDQ